MKINSVLSQSSYIKNFTQKNKQTKVNKDNIVEQDKYISSTNQTENITYKKPVEKSNEVTIQKLKEESEQVYSNLREMVRQILERQGLTFKAIENEDIKVKIDEETRLEAQAMIGEGGYLSPEKVSDRIVGFAKAISGGDKEKLEVLTSAIKEGFKQAEKALGQELPEISQKTYDLVIQKLDEWVNE